MTSEDIYEVRLELSDLNYLCSHASLACKGFPEMIATNNRANYDPLSCVASLATKNTVIQSIIMSHVIDQRINDVDIYQDRWV